MAPSTGYVKVNTDCSSVDGSCAGGCVVRNRSGGLVIAYAVPLGGGSNFHAEIAALLEDLLLCANNSICINEIEIDSKALYDSFNGLTACPWEHIHYEKL